METFVFAQLRDRERRGGRTGSLSGATERAKWTSLWMPADAWNCLKRNGRNCRTLGDTVNLDFVGNVIGKPRVAAGRVVSRTPNSFPFPNSFRALPVTELK